MPSSTYEHIKTLAAFFYRTRPRSILALLAGREDYLAFRMEQLAGIRPIEGPLDPAGS
jgi:hypothetical protein